MIRRGRSPELSTNSLNMKHEVETIWMGRMKFNALVNGHTIVMDAPERVGGENEGPIPKPLMLTALSGCTGMDVVNMLGKAGHTLKGFDIRVSGELSKGTPMVYTEVHVTYEAHGEQAAEAEFLQAVMRSQTDLCGASAMLRKAMSITWEVIFNDECIYSNRSGQFKVMEDRPLSASQGTDSGSGSPVVP